MKKFVLVIAALVVTFATAGCSTILTGPLNDQPSASNPLPQTVGHRSDVYFGGSGGPGGD